MYALIPSPSSSQISIGPATLHYYALCIIAGISVAIWLGRKRYAANGGSADDVSEAQFGLCHLELLADVFIT